MCFYDLHSAQQYMETGDVMQTLHLAECILCTIIKLASDDSSIGRPVIAGQSSVRRAHQDDFLNAV